MTISVGSVLNWIEAHPGTAAWVQAIGALLAIGFAFGIAHWELHAARRKEETERRMRAQGLSFLLHTEMVAFRTQLEEAGTEVRHFESVPKPPDAIVRLADQIYVLGSTGEAILQMLSILNAHGRLQMPVMAEWADRQIAMDLASERLKMALKNCDIAIAGLQKIIDRQL